MAKITRIQKNADITAWLEYFTDGFLSSLHVLNAEVRMLGLSLSTSDGNIHLNREDEDILSYVAKFGSINISEAEDILPEMNRRSIQRRLKQLVDDGYLEAVGLHMTRNIFCRSTQKNDQYLAFIPRFCELCSGDSYVFSARSILGSGVANHNLFFPCVASDNRSFFKLMPTPMLYPCMRA